MTYKVKVDNFEGPIDLLLFFIKRDKLNIYDIPIFHIVDEFFNYIQLMEELNINLGGEFIYMASLLMKIKSNMLLPSIVDENSNIDDPRIELVEKLLEYKHFKEISSDLEKIYQEHQIYSAKGHEFEIDESSKLSIGNIDNVDVFKLSSVFRNLINKLPETNPYELKEEIVYIEDQILFISERIKRKNNLSFNKLVSVLETKISIVVTFLALLEMLRSKQVKIKQNNPFGELIIIRLK